MRNWIRYLAFWPVVLMISGAAPADPPPDVGYQGRLVDAAGNPVIGTASIEIRVFDQLTGGTQLYREIHPNVGLQDGVFSILLGTGDFQEPEGAFDGDLFNEQNRFLEVLVDGEVLEPRQPFSSVAYAFQAGDAATVGLLQPTEIVTNSTLEASFATNVTQIAEGQVPDPIARDAEVAAQDAALQAQITTLEAQLAALQAQVDGLDLSRFEGIVRDGDTFRFEGMNVQVVNGLGDTETTNSLGNLIVGYNEPRVISNNRNGSHNLVVGRQQNFGSYGGIVGGLTNSVVHPYSSVTGGEGNGTFGTAFAASITGGTGNAVQGPHAAVTGGAGNRANGEFSTVSGGQNNTAEGDRSSVSGGVNNTAMGVQSSVTGGTGNRAEGDRSVVLGGGGNTSQGVGAAVVAGDNNIASGRRSAILGGLDNSVSGEDSTVAGGINRTVSADFTAAEARTVFSSDAPLINRLSSSDQVIDSITIEAPTNGQVSITAVGYMNTFNEPILGDAEAKCEVTTGTTISDNNGLGDVGVGFSELIEAPFAITKVFNVFEGSSTFNLVCVSDRGDENDLYVPQMTAIFTPTPGAIQP